MSKFTKVLWIVALALVVNVGAAQARYGGHGGGWHGGGGGWHGGGYRGGYYGGWGWGGGWGTYWGPNYYSYGLADCGWVRVRVLRNDRWVVRRVWRCW